jgi:hypothetical protein
VNRIATAMLTKKLSSTRRPTTGRTIVVAVAAIPIRSQVEIRARWNIRYNLLALGNETHSKHFDLSGQRVSHPWHSDPKPSALKLLN